MAAPATRGDVIPVRDVMARWAYTEVVGAHASACYDNCTGIEALRAMRRAGVSFADLSASDRSLLFSAWSCVRGAFFGPYLTTAGSYRLAQCTRASLLIVRVPRGVDPKHAHHPLLTEFFRSGSSDPDDRRNAHKEQGVLPSSDPLTLGLHEGSYVIGDCLHRARTFPVASAPSTIAVYMPLR